MSETLGGSAAASRGFTAAWVVAVGLAVAAALLAIWWPPYTPGQDTPHHLFFAEVVAHPDRFAADYRVIVAPNAQGFVYLAALFEPLVGLVAAGKVVRTLGLGLLLVAYWVLGRAAGQRRPPGLILAAAVSASFFHAMGFENFALALPFGLLALGVAIEGARTGGARRWVAMGALLALTSVAHSVMAGMLGVELVLVVALVAPRGTRWRRLGALVVASVPAGAHAAACVLLSARSQAERGVTAGLGTQRLPAYEQLENLVDCSFGGYSDLGAFVVVAVIGLAASAWLGRRGASGATSAASRDTTRVALATLGLWAVAYFAAPFHAAGWAYAQPRILALLVFAPVGLLGWGRWRGANLVATTAAVLAFVLSSAVYQHTAGEAIAVQVARFGEGPVGRAMAVTLDPGHPPTSKHVGPLSGSEMYAVAQGGAVPHVHAANPAIHAVLARRLPPEWPPHPPLFIYKSLDCAFNADCEQAAVTLVERIAVQGLQYDTVLLVGGPVEFREALAARGYGRPAPDRLVPRPGALELVLPATARMTRAGLVVRAGYPDGLGWFIGAQRPPGEASEPVVWTLEPLPAGPLVIDCRWVDDPAGLSAIDAAPVACGLVTRVVAGERHRVEVELVEP